VIQAPVGPNLLNKFVDVRVVQLLLNMAAAEDNRLPGVDPDGFFGSMTRNAIAMFQSLAMGVMPTGIVAPFDATLAELGRHIPAGVTPEKVHGALVNAEPIDVQIYFPGIGAVFERYEISTPRRIAHFLAQVGHESGDLRYHEEIASGLAYEGRLDLGNTEPGDGPRFKGRGLIQLTGRANYAAYGEAIGRDLTVGENWEQVAEDPLLATDVAGWFWSCHKLNAPADAGNIRRVTRVINGGYNGLNDRIARLGRAAFFWR
jgi:putative chitinase